MFYLTDDYGSDYSATDERFLVWLEEYLREEGFSDEEIEAYIEEGDPEDLRYVFDDEEAYNRMGPGRYYGCDY